MLRNALSFVVLALCTVAAIGQEAQQPSRFDFFTGYSYANPRTTLRGGLDLKDQPRGFDLNGTYFFNNWAGLTVDGAGNFGSVADTGTIQVGPTVRFANFSGVQPFLHALIGLHEMNVAGLDSSAGIGITGGGGLDFQTKWPRVAVRLIQADVQYGHHNFAPRNRTDIVGARLSTGLVWHFGTLGPPPAAPTAACKADPSEVFEGEPVTVTATTQNFDPKHKLNYNWAGAQGISVKGADATAQVDTKGLQPGSYPVSVTVTDKKLTAQCSANVVVKQPRPPQISCSANPTSLKPGENATISCQCTSPDNRQLKYSHQASAGQISGDGASVSLSTQGVPPGGSATVNSTCTDDRNLSANTSTTINVEAPPPPPAVPEPTEIERRLALHSVYFSTAQPTKANPKGGLVPSQQRILSDLAKDFKAYLADKPDARLKLEAHADQRGSDAYNQALTERRAGAVKAFLAKYGVPEANIDTEAFGKQQNLTSDQVQKQIESDPQLTPGERQRITKNMKTIVLANNRRVDIVLQIPGRPPEASIRQYPFNAGDALSLIGGREKPAKAATTKKSTAKKGTAKKGTAKKAPAKKKP